MKYIIAFEFPVEARVHDDITCKREGAITYSESELSVTKLIFDERS